MLRILCFLCLLFSCHSAFAEIYRYTTDTGETIYVTEQNQVPERYRSQVAQPHSLPKITKDDFHTPRVDTAKKSSKKQVEIYVTSWCGYCKKAEQFLKKHNVRFKKYDIEKSSTGRKKHSQAGGGGVPVLKIGSEYIRGYSEPALRKALGL